MKVRFIPGLGRATYNPVEDELARSLIAGGHHDEVLFLHELKVELDAVAVEDDDSWATERAAVFAGRGVQGVLA